MKNDAMQIALSGISARIEISPRGRESWGGKNGESKGIRNGPPPGTKFYELEK
jgi:hypothetical protein